VWADNVLNHSFFKNGSFSGQRWVFLTKRNESLLKILEKSLKSAKYDRKIAMDNSTRYQRRAESGPGGA
jgi:hypothetical protein